MQFELQLSASVPDIYQAKIDLVPRQSSIYLQKFVCTVQRPIYPTVKVDLYINSQLLRSPTAYLTSYDLKTNQGIYTIFLDDLELLPRSNHSIELICLFNCLIKSVELDSTNNPTHLKTWDFGRSGQPEPSNLILNEVIAFFGQPETNLLNQTVEDVMARLPEQLNLAHIGTKMLTRAEPACLGARDSGLGVFYRWPENRDPYSAGDILASIWCDPGHLVTVLGHFFRKCHYILIRYDVFEYDQPGGGPASALDRTLGAIDDLRRDLNPPTAEDCQIGQDIVRELKGYGLPRIRTDGYNRFSLEYQHPRPSKIHSGEWEYSDDATIVNLLPDPVQRAKELFARLYPPE